MADENDKTFQMRVNDAFLRKLDQWRRGEPDLPPRAEAVRRLVDAGIQATRSRKASTKR